MYISLIKKAVIYVVYLTEMLLGLAFVLVLGIELTARGLQRMVSELVRLGACVQILYVILYV